MQKENYKGSKEMKIKKYSFYNPSVWIISINLFALLVWVLTPSQFFESNVGNIKKMNSNLGLFFYFIFIIIFGFSTYFGEKLNYKRFSRIIFFEENKFKLKQKSLFYALILGGIATSIQLVWFIFTIRDMGFDLFLNSIFLMRSSFLKKSLSDNSITGITTLTHLSIISTSLYSIYYFIFRKKNNFITHILWVIPLFPGLLRGIIFSERYAIMQLLLIILFIYIYKKLIIESYSLVFIIRKSVIFFSIIIMIFIFGSYFRTYLTIGKDKNIILFGLKRLISYIVSSINYGIMIIEKHNEFSMIFPNQFLNFIYSGFNINNNYNNILNIFTSSVYGNPGYNTISMVGASFLDLKFLSLFYASFYGGLVGFFYNQFKKGEIIGIVLYPILLSSIFDTYRTLPFSNFRIIITIFLTILIFKRY